MSKLKTLSALIQRLQLAARAGLQFDGARDLYKVFGYKRNISYEDYLAKYVRQDIAGRIIDAPAQATWRSPPLIKSDKEGFKEAWDTTVRRTKLWPTLERIDKLAGLGQFSVGLLGFNDSSTFEPAVKASPTIKLLYIQPLAETAVEITAYEDDTRSPRYGQPKLYKVTLSAVKGDKIVSNTPLIVHHSRILHIVENPLQSLVSGTPRLSRVFNLLDDVMKVAGGSAETFWLTANKGIQADIDKEMEIDPTDAVELANQIDEYQHQLRRVLRTRGVKINSLGSDTPDPTGNFRVLISLISGATGIPQRILLGAEAGQLASEQDRANWAERVGERRTSFAEPYVLMPLLEKLMAAGVLPEDEMYKMEWPEAFHLSPLEKAQTMAQRARALANLTRQHQVGHFIATKNEERLIIGLPPIDEESFNVIPPDRNPNAGDEEIDEDNLDESDELASEEGSEGTDSPENPDEIDLEQDSTARSG